MSNNIKLIVSSHGQSPSNFTIDYRDKIKVQTQMLVADDNKMEPVQKILTYLMCLDSGYVPHMISNINSRYDNRSVSYTYNGDTVNLSIDNGLYNVEQLYEWLQDKMKENGDYQEPNADNGYEEWYPIVISKSSSSGKVKIVVDNGMTLTLNSNLANMLGFTSTTVFNTGTHTSNLPSNMGTTQPINIHCDLINNSWSNTYRTSTIASFLPSKYYGEMMNITPIHKSYFPITVSDIASINIRMTYAGTNEEVVFDRDEPVILHLHIVRESV